MEMMVAKTPHQLKNALQTSNLRDIRDGEEFGLHKHLEQMQMEVLMIMILKPTEN